MPSEWKTCEFGVGKGEAYGNKDQKKGEQAMKRRKTAVILGTAALLGTAVLLGAAGIFLSAAGSVHHGAEEQGAFLPEGEASFAKNVSGILQNAAGQEGDASGQEDDSGQSGIAPLLPVEEWEKMPIGEYPINIDSPEWEGMSYTEACAACNMPKELAESLTTEELAKYAINYPHLGVALFVFNSLKDGLDSLKNKSYVFSELYARPDCNQRLLEEYLDLSCDYRLLEEENDMIGSNYEKKTYLEAYFGMNYGELTEQEKDIFMEEFEKKYEEQPESIQEYSGARIFYAAKRESMPSIPEGWGADPSYPFAGRWGGF